MTAATCNAAPITQSPQPDGWPASLVLMALAGAVGFCFALAPRSVWARGGVGAGIAVLSVACFAPVVPVPNTFSNGTPADATEVNQNFSSLVNQLGTHVDDTARHPTSLSDLAGGTIQGDLAVSGTITAASVTFPNGGSVTGGPDGSVTVQASGATIVLSSQGVQVTGTQIDLSAQTFLNGSAGTLIDLDATAITLN